MLFEQNLGMAKQESRRSGEFGKVREPHQSSQSALFGQLVSKYMQVHGLQNQDVARLVYKNEERKSSVSDLLVGRFKPRPETVARFRDALRIPQKEIDEIFSPQLGIRRPTAELPEEEVERLAHVYVPPINYEEAKETLLRNRLVVIRGPGSIGKTTTAINLLAELRRARVLKQPILKPISVLQDLGELEGVEDKLILLDSLFGPRDAYEPSEPYIAAHFGHVVDMSRRNWVVLTTRHGPLDEAKRLIERRDLDQFIIDLSLDSYTDTKLRKIFFKHVAFNRQQGRLTAKTIDYIRDPDKISWIIRNLRFPHNIFRFIQDELPHIENQEDIKAALDRSKDTKEAARLFFIQRTSAEIYFMLAVAFFGHHMDEDRFMSVIRDLTSVCAIPLSESDIPLMRRSLRYVSKEGNVAFQHQDYLDGVLDAVRRDPTFDINVKRFGPLLDKLSKRHDAIVLRCLGFPLKEMARLDPQGTSAITLNLLRNDKPEAVRSAYIPLRVLVKNQFETVRPFLEQAVAVDSKMKRDPNYRTILFRKAMRKYLLIPHIERRDVASVIEFSAEFSNHLKVEIFIFQALYDVYKRNETSAIEFFRAWWLYDPRRSLTGLQDAAMYRSATISRALFIAKLVGAIDIDRAVKALVDWSMTESKREDTRARLCLVLGICLKYLDRMSPGSSIKQMVDEWAVTGNEVQRGAVRRFRSEVLPR